MTSTAAATMPFATDAGGRISHASRMDATNDSTATMMVRDLLLLAALLAGLNVVLAPADAGWLGLNPTPWLLPCLLIGARYGVASGTTAGLLTALGISLVRARIEGADPWAFAAEHRYLLTGLVSGGFLAGQLNQLLRSDSKKLQRDNRRLNDDVERLRSELGLVNETRHDLQQRLALHNAPFACLDTELKKLVSLPAGEIFGGLLQLLHRQAGVTSAGIYTLDDGTLRRDAVIHPTAPLAATIPLSQCRLAARAVEEQSIASLSHPLESSKDQPFLTAIPWRYNQHGGVLLIQDMPLESFEWHNLARIEVVLHWALTMRRHAESFGHGIAARTLMPLEDFMMLLAQALETEQAHGLPSAVVRFDLTPGDVSVSSDGRQITRALPASALTTRTPDGGFVSLLPFTSDHGAEVIARGIKEHLPAVRTSHYLVVGPAKLEELWTRILAL